jgi:hypothetical protein
MKRKRKKKGLLLAPDDLEVGRFIAVHSTKGSNRPLPFFGLAAEVKAINLPFLVVRMVGTDEIVTIDVRLLNIMPVTREFAHAQAPHKTMTMKNDVLVDSENVQP